MKTHSWSPIALGLSRYSQGLTVMLDTAPSRTATFTASSQTLTAKIFSNCDFGPDRQAVTS